MYRKRCPGSDHQGGVDQKNRAWKMPETLPTTGTVHTKPISSLENGKGATIKGPEIGLPVAQ